MFANVPTVPLSGSLSPVGIASTDSSSAAPDPTHLRVHGAELNVLEGDRITIEGKLMGRAPGGLGARLVDLQASHGLLDRPLQVVDLRLPDRLVIRPAGDRPAPARKPT